jgi:hypothetical protein
MTQATQTATPETNTMQDFFGEVIYAYTRAQAIADGEQVELTDDLTQMAQQLYKYPIYLTRSVFDLIERAVNNKRHCNDWKGVLWDILYMSQKTGRRLDPQTTQFTVIITGAARKKYHTFLIQCGPIDIDNPAPALTIMHPEEQ